MFDRFVDRSRTVLGRAREEAIGLGHDYIATHHLLLGLARVEDPVVRRVLAVTGTGADGLRALVRARADPPGAPLPAGQLPFTPLAKRALERALMMSRHLGSPTIDPVHLLLGVLGVRDGLGGTLLTELGVTPRVVWDALRAEGAPPGREAPAGSTASPDARGYVRARLARIERRLDELLAEVETLRDLLD